MRRTSVRRALAALSAPILFAFLLSSVGAGRAAQAAEDAPPAWAAAWQKGPMSAEETRAFMKRLAQFVFDNHLKRNAASAQRGMIYEYLDTARRGELDQFVQGEALDTMHDGAWFAAALVNAYRATGDPFYKEFLTQWVMPFYCKMLNHSDTLFTTKRNDARPGTAPWGKEWALQEGEKGFVPYFWDDGGSVSIERRREKNPVPSRPTVDNLAGKPNPNYLLDGYSQGSSNHMAQDLGVMVQQVWLLLRASKDPADKKLADEVAEAARNLHACRMNHFGKIPMCVAPAALASGDAELMRAVPDQSTEASWTSRSHYINALYAYTPGQRMPFPGFADDQQYRYYFGVARHGGKLPPPLAFQTVYNAYTERMLYRTYVDDQDVPPGINVFDLHPYGAVDGKPTDYRSDRKGPNGGPRPIGSRFGPQNMVCCGWALQILKATPGIWEERLKSAYKDDLRVHVFDIPLVPATTPVMIPAARVSLGGADVIVSSIRTALTLSGRSAGTECTLTLFSRPDGQGSQAVVHMKAGGGSTAVNDKGEALQADIKTLPAANGFTFLASIPYSAAKGQKEWANGVEFGRYSLRVGDATRNFVIASDEEVVKRWLEHELGRGLRTWEAIFNEKGYIPTGIGTGADWDRYSDTGGYAHLLSAASEWLLYLDGKRDWELQQVP